MNWRGVMPAITTPFRADSSVDHEFLARHASWLLDHGCTGLVALGSLGEGATLGREENAAILRTCVRAAAGRAPVVAAVSALSTAEGVESARAAAGAGCAGLMVLPAYAHRGDRREAKAHARAIMDATPLACMLYNNPIAYGTDVAPGQIAELAGEAPNMRAVKESSGDVRRITAIRALAGDRLAVLAGLDDLVVEGLAAGAVGWVAGLANALPRESVALFDLASRGERERAAALYRWFLPLLRLDTVPKFVQLIKLVQAEVGMGGPRVRPPRLELQGSELEEALGVIRSSLERRPAL